MSTKYCTWGLRTTGYAGGSTVARGRNGTRLPLENASAHASVRSIWTASAGCAGISGAEPKLEMPRSPIEGGSDSVVRDGSVSKLAGERGSAALRESAPSAKRIQKPRAAASKRSRIAIEGGKLGHFYHAFRVGSMLRRDAAGTLARRQLSRREV